MKVVISQSGSFGLSPRALLLLWQRGGQVEAKPVAEYYGASCMPHAQNDLEHWRAFLAGQEDSARGSCWHYTVFTPDEQSCLVERCDNRADSNLVAVVEELGAKAAGWSADLKVVEVPDDVDWFVFNNDRTEWIAEKHRTWS